jgi:hypothetical protein
MKLLPGVAGLMTLVLTHGAAGKEYLIGHRLHEHDMQIYANWCGNRTHGA